MEMKKKMSPGYLSALIIGACIMVVALLHIVVAYYFLRAKFEIHEVEYSDEAPADAPLEPAASTASPA
jgi:hypothetical protein